jgi:hypothetical protein
VGPAEAITAVAWAILKSADKANGGRGAMVCKQDAQDILERARRIGRRSVNRILRDGEGRYWTTDATGRMWLYSPDRAAHALGVEYVSRLHLVHLSRLRTPAKISAAIVSTVYRTDENGRPISRRTVEERTGITARQQRRQDADLGYVERVEEVHVRLTEADDPRPSAERRRTRQMIANEGLRSRGFYVGRYGHLMRRDADVRRAVDTELAPRAASRRVNKRLAARSKEECVQSRDDAAPAPARSSYFYGRSFSEALRKWRRAPNARGKGRVDPLDVIPDHAVLAFGPPGRRRHEAVHDKRKELSM